MSCVCFFFFKQKTAYEMRISDWSSDVCSSDLQNSPDTLHISLPYCARRIYPDCDGACPILRNRRDLPFSFGTGERVASAPRRRLAFKHAISVAVAKIRSEEHTSELQSLMRISYAVFCLKKKKNITQKTTQSM